MFRKYKLTFTFKMIIMLIISVLSIDSVHAAVQWKAGVAAEAITPSKPMWTGGYGGRKIPAEGKVHDLFVKALALEDPQGGKVVIVTADLLGYPYGFSNDIAGEIEKKWGIPRDSIIFNASHTHCGPEIYHWPVKTVFVDYIPDEFFAKIGPYKKWLHTKFVEVIDRALSDLSPADVTFSSGRPVPFTVSRRFPDGKGGVLYRSSPSSYYTEGPRDDISPALKVTAPDGNVRAVLFGYTCHPITLNLDQFCADYPGFAQEYIEQAFPGSIALFMQGAHGEIVPNARFQIEYAMGHGRALADAVIRAVEGRQTPLSGPLRTDYREVKLNFAPIPDRNGLKEIVETGTAAEARKATFLLEKIEKGEEIDLTFPAPFHAISFGPELLMLGFPGDTVVDYSVNCKEEFSDRARFVWVSGSNNYCGAYLPTLQILREGGYEGGDRMRSTAFPGPFAEDVEELTMNGVRELVNNVTR